MHIGSRNQHNGSRTSRKRQPWARRKPPPNPPPVKQRRLADLNADASLSFDERDNGACAPRDKSVLDGCVDSVAGLVFDGGAVIVAHSPHDSSAVRGRNGYTDKRDNDIPRTKRIGRSAPMRLSNKTQERFTPFPMNDILSPLLLWGMQRSSGLTAKSASELRWLSWMARFLSHFAAVVIGCRLASNNPIDSTQASPPQKISAG